MEIKQNISLKPYNTFGIDVSASKFVEANSLTDIQEFLNDYKTIHDTPLLIMGGGSNILFTGDFKGIVLKINIRGIDIIDENKQYIYIKAYSGENWESFVNYCIEKGWGGIENLSLIPGNVGSCPVQNIGAYGVEVKDVIYELEAINIISGEIKIFRNEMCNFGYRDSIFKKELKNLYIIHSVTFKLNKEPVLRIKYGAIEDELKVMGISNPSIESVGKAICTIRRKKLPDYHELGNAGSFFKNPTVPVKFFKELKIKYPGLVGYQLPEGGFKLAAAFLIEACGWKGKKESRCGVHDKQSLVLVNYGNASGREIVELANKIKDSVYQKFNVNLETEVNIF